MPIRIRQALEFDQGRVDLHKPLLRLLPEQLNELFLEIVLGLLWFRRHRGSCL